MKKISLYLFSILAVSLMGMTSVHAIDVAGAKSRTWDMTVTGGENGQPTTIQLKTDSDAGLEVGENENVILDLNGHKLTNYCVGNESPSGCTGASAVIEIKKGGTLTITDSKNDGNTGSITQKASTTNMIAIDNKGTLIIEKGNITGLGTVGNQISVILNQGNMEVKGGTITSTASTKSSAIHNLGTITFTGGEIKTGAEDSWGLLNYGTATINGGTFTQNYKYSVIQNSGEMTIENGTFKNGESGEHYSLITNENVGNTANKGNASLIINGGSFEGNIVLSNGETGKGDITVNKGTFKTTQDISKLIDPSSEMDGEGNVVKKALHKIEVKSNKNASIKISKDSTYEGDSVKITVNPKKGYEVDKITVKTASGKNVKVSNKTFVMPNEDVTVEVTLRVVTNPATGDNLLTYVSLGAIALIGALGTGLYLKKVNK